MTYQVWLVAGPTAGVRRVTFSAWVTGALALQHKSSTAFLRQEECITFAEEEQARIFAVGVEEAGGIAEVRFEPGHPTGVPLAPGGRDTMRASTINGPDTQEVPTISDRAPQLTASAAPAAPAGGSASAPPLRALPVVRRGGYDKAAVDSRIRQLASERAAIAERLEVSELRVVELEQEVAVGRQIALRRVSGVVRQLEQVSSEAAHDQIVDNTRTEQQLAERRVRLLSYLLRATGVTEDPETVLLELEQLQPDGEEAVRNWMTGDGARWIHRPSGQAEIWLDV